MTVWMVYIDNSQLMENYNILKFIDTWDMTSFDNSCRIISSILTWMSVGYQFLNNTYTFLMLQINASIMWLEILNTYFSAKMLNFLEITFQTTAVISYLCIIWNVL